MLVLRALDFRSKVTMSFDYLFGRGVSRYIPVERLELAMSRKTGRIRSISLEGKHLATFRSNGSIAISIYGAELLVKSPSFLENCVVVHEEIESFVSDGLSVFAKYVVKCGKKVRPGSEVAVLNSNGKVIAVGKAILSAKMIEEFKTGVAVKVRRGICK